MLRRYYASLGDHLWSTLGSSSSLRTWDRSLATVVARDTVTRVDSARYNPQPLSESLAEFEGILSQQEVQTAPEMVKVNHESFQRLMHFLKSYTKGLRKDEPLGQQLHTLEFVIPGHDDPASLRRLVVKVGTPGGSNGHKIVSRCIQGLFRAAGISPNFVWDEAFEIPDRYTSYEEQRKRLEEAALDEKVKQIQAVQRGEKLSKNSPLTTIDSKDYLQHDAKSDAESVSTGNEMVTEAAGLAPPAQDARITSGGLDGDKEPSDFANDDDDHEPEDIEALAADVDEKLRLLAMTPWIRAYGELRAEEEQKIANELIMYMSEVLPGFGTIVPHVWEGEVDPNVLTKELLQGQHADVKPWITACAQQLCSCFEALVAEHGPPDPNKTIARKLLVRTTAPVAVAAELARTL